MNDLIKSLTRYQDEKRTLMDQLRHFLLSKEDVLAAWILASSPPTRLVDGPTPAVQLEVIVNDEQYGTISGSIETRKRFVKDSGRILLTSIVDTDALPLYVIPTTEILVVYSGEVAPHAIQLFWIPLSEAVFPSNYAELLFEKEAMHRTDGYGGTFAERDVESTTFEERVWRAYTDRWAVLIRPMYDVPRHAADPFNDPTIQSEKVLSYITQDINKLEQLLGVPGISQEALFHGADTLSVFAAARHQVDHLEHLNSIIAARGIDGAHADLPDQARKLIDLVEEVVRVGWSNLPVELQRWKWSGQH